MCQLLFIICPCVGRHYWRRRGLAALPDPARNVRRVPDAKEGRRLVRAGKAEATGPAPHPPVPALPAGVLRLKRPSPPCAPCLPDCRTLAPCPCSRAGPGASASKALTPPTSPSLASLASLPPSHPPPPPRPPVLRLRLDQIPACALLPATDPRTARHAPALCFRPARRPSCISFCSFSVRGNFVFKLSFGFLLSWNLIFNWRRKAIFFLLQFLTL